METKTRVMPNQSFKKILIVSLDNIGDTVMATSVIRPLRHAFPHAKIGLWCKKYVADLFADHLNVDCLHAADPFWDRSPGLGKGRFSDLVKSWFEIRQEKYDAAIIVNTEWRRGAAVWLARIPVRVGFDRRKSALFLTSAIPCGRGDGPVIDELRRLVESWRQDRVPDEFWIPKLDVAAPDQLWFSSWRTEKGWDHHPLLVFHPFSGDERKNWPFDRWVHFIHALHAARPDVRFALLCSRFEKNSVSSFDVAEKDNFVHVFSDIPLNQVKALLQQARVFVGGDSGPGHIAAAVGTPVISLFSATKASRYAPRGTGKAQVLQRPSMTSIDVDDVVAAAMPFVSDAQGTLSA